MDKKSIGLDFNNLTKSQIIKVNSVIGKIQEEFNRFIESMYQKNDNDIGFLVSIPVSRHTVQSTLFSDYLKLRIAEIHASQNHDLEINFNKNHLHIIYKRKHQLHIPKKEILKARTSLLIVNFYIRLVTQIKGLLKIFIYIFWSLFCRSVKRKVRLKNVDVLIDTFILENSFKSSKYIDRYYPGLLEELSDLQKQNIFFIPTFLSYTSKKKINKIFNESEHNFIFEMDYLMVSDYFNAVKILLNNKLKSKRYTFYGFDLSDLVEQEHKKNKFNFSSFLGILKYLFIRRLAEDNSLKLLVDWNENQPIDRGLLKGIRDFSPLTKTKGYQGFIVSNSFHFYLFPTQYEIEAGVIPDEICVVGNGLKNVYDKYIKRLKISVAPAFRFNLVKEKKHSDYSERKYVLVILPINENESIEILNDLITNKVFLNSISFKLKIRPHPILDFHKIVKKLNLKKHLTFEVDTQKISDSLASIKLALGSSSSVLVEILTFGIPVIIIANKNGISQNPIPPGVPDNMWKISYSGDDLQVLLEELLQYDSEDYLKLSELGQKVQSLCFESPNKYNVSEFLDYSL